jgi:hypothetical protein
MLRSVMSDDYPVRARLPLFDSAGDRSGVVSPYTTYERLESKSRLGL